MLGTKMMYKYVVVYNRDYEFFYSLPMNREDFMMLTLLQILEAFCKAMFRNEANNLSASTLEASMDMLRYQTSNLYYNYHAQKRKSPTCRNQSSFSKESTWNGVVTAQRATPKKWISLSQCEHSKVYDIAVN